MTPSLTDRLAVLWERLDTPARTWLANAVLDVAAADHESQRPVSLLELRFAEAGRHCGSLEDVARVLLLHAAQPDVSALTGLYTRGSGAERRAVLYALPFLVSGPDALPLVEDALRTNDTRLVAAAVGPYAARHLDASSWRHAVLKCLFTGVSLAEVSGLRPRAAGDGELARMLTDFATERRAAGRPVPADLDRALRLTTQDS
jgi:hypothetical protein